LITFFGLGAALAFAQEYPLDNIASRQYQHEIRRLRLALDRWLQTMGLQEMGLSIRLVKTDDLPENTCGMSSFNVQTLIGEIDVLRSDEYAKLPDCLDGACDPQRALESKNRLIQIRAPGNEEGAVRRAKGSEFGAVAVAVGDVAEMPHESEDGVKYWRSPDYGYRVAVLRKDMYPKRSAGSRTGERIRYEFGADGHHSAN
jgi:hypothetical protein